MLVHTVFGVLTAIATIISASPLKKRDAISDEVTALYAASNPNARYALLNSGPTAASGGGLFFNFLNATSFGGGGKDGGVVLADNTVFPGVVGNGMSMLMGFLGPCGMVAPHVHPRATEYLLNIAGESLLSHVVSENGAAPITTVLESGQVGVLPQGSIHMVTSTSCQPTLIAAGFNSESPGVLLLSTAYTGFDIQTIDAAFGAQGAIAYNASIVPTAVALGQQSCLSKCGLSQSYDISSLSKSDLMKAALASWLKNQT